MTANRTRDDDWGDDLFSDWDDESGPRRRRRSRRERRESRRGRRRSRQETRNTKAPVVRDEHVLVSIAVAPFRFCQRSYRHLSSIRGFGIIASVMTVYCAGLSVETIMVSIPRATQREGYTEEVRRTRRFIPKPYVDDGAELGRLNPLPNLQRAVLQKYFTWLPMWIRGNIQSDYWTVWNEPGILLLSVVVAITIQKFEGMIWRKKSFKTTREEFEEANSIKNVEADSRSIALAHYKAQQHNQQGTGSILGTFFAIVVLYGLEIAAFVGSFAGAGSWAINAVYGFLTIAGFEVFDRQSDDAPED